MFLDRTLDLPNWMDTMRIMIEAKQTRVADEEQQRGAQQAPKEQKRLGRQANRDQRAAAEDARKTAARNECLRQ